MRIARPTVSEERWLMVAARYPALRTVSERAEFSGGWKSTTWLGRCLGFVLGLLAAGMLAAALSLFPAPWLTGGLLCVVAAEWLVAQRRVFRSGIEEALYVCGAVAIVAQLIIWNSSSDRAWLGIALIAAAVLLAGWRLLNPLFTTLAAAGYSLAIALFDTQLFSGPLNSLAASLACAVLAVGALIAGAREYQRPAHDRMLDGLVILMPWLAYGWMLDADRGGAAGDYAALALALGFLATHLIVGVKRRQHAPLIGALGNLVLAAHALYELLPLPLYLELIAAGALLLAAATGLDRTLRDRRQGITSRKIDEPAGLDLAQLAGAANIAPAAVAAPEPGVQGQGGDFGGGGASGRF